MHPIKPELDKISSSFCAAKWLQVTLRLQNGHNHSCHHPKPHQISKQEVLKNPSALHNTWYKKLQRKKMLAGTRPGECSYCWKVEDLPGQQTSDRHIKSGDTWAASRLKEVSEIPWDENVNPTYLEVSFSNVCNFKCAYCAPDISSKWMSEVKEFGPYPTSNPFGSLLYLKKEGMLPLSDEKNVFIDAFWKWIPEILNGLQVLRITGGEPLLSRDCLKLFEFINQNPNPNLQLSVNTNLGVPTNLVEKVLKNLNELVENKKIKSAQIYTSLDTWGRQAEYLRYGLDLSLWKTNFDLCLKASKNIQTVTMVTFNALSVFKFKDFLKYILEKRQVNPGNVLIDISILHDPPFLNLLILEEEQKALIKDCLQYMKDHSSPSYPNGFFDFEIIKLKRIEEYAHTQLSKSELSRRRIDFVSFIEEYDRRKNTHFIKCFPELTVSFEKWQSLVLKQNIVFKVLKKAARLAHHQLPRLF